MQPQGPDWEDGGDWLERTAVKASGLQVLMLRALAESMAQQVVRELQETVERALRPEGAEKEEPTPLLLSARQAARRLGVSTTRMHALLDRGEIPFVRDGRAKLVRPEALEEWITQQEQLAREHAWRPRGAPPTAPRRSRT